jgi:hypothetical protein
MIRYNFINTFKTLAQDYTRKTGIDSSEFSNNDFSTLNKQLFEIINKKYSKEIPYSHLIHSKELQRDIIVYIPNKDLGERKFKKNGSNYNFTTDYINYVSLKDIPIDNFILEIDSGRIDDLSPLKNNKPNKDNFEIIEGTLNIEKYYNNENKDEVLYKMIDLDGLTYFNNNKSGIYFVDSSDNQINGIIMLDKTNKLYTLNYVNISNNARNKGLSLKMYEKMMDYVVKNNGILLRSIASDMGAAFIENKITKMLRDKYPYEPILDERTKDLHAYIKLGMESQKEISNENIKLLKATLKDITYERMNINQINVLGEFNAYSIPLKTTENDRSRVLKYLTNDNQPTTKKKIKKTI